MLIDDGAPSSANFDTELEPFDGRRRDDESPFQPSRSAASTTIGKTGASQGVSELETVHQRNADRDFSSTSINSAPAASQAFVEQDTASKQGHVTLQPSSRTFGRSSRNNTSSRTLEGDKPHNAEIHGNTSASEFEDQFAVTEKHYQPSGATERIIIEDVTASHGVNILEAASQYNIDPAFSSSSENVMRADAPALEPQLDSTNSDQDSSNANPWSHSREASPHMIAVSRRRVASPPILTGPSQNIAQSCGHEPLSLLKARSGVSNQAHANLHLLNFEKEDSELPYDNLLVSDRERSDCVDENSEADHIPECAASTDQDSLLDTDRPDFVLDESETIAQTINFQRDASHIEAGAHYPSPVTSTDSAVQEGKPTETLTKPDAGNHRVESVMELPGRGHNRTQASHRSSPNHVVLAKDEMSSLAQTQQTALIDDVLLSSFLSSQKPRSDIMVSSDPTTSEDGRRLAGENLDNE